jgi:hypothetical protein
MSNTILSLIRVLFLILGGHEQVALENRALREQLGVSPFEDLIRPADTYREVRRSNMPKSRNRKTMNRKHHGGSKRAFAAHLIRQTAYFPLRECLITEDWQEHRMASILFARNRPGGRVAFAAFCVDLGCLGVKSAFAHPDISLAEYEHRIVAGAATRQIRCDPAFGVKMIQGAEAYARQLGFRPDPDYLHAREIFGDIDPASCSETITYGEGGKPFYVSGPRDDVDRIMNHLIRTLGHDGFHFMACVGRSMEGDLLDDPNDEDWERQSQVAAYER